MQSAKNVKRSRTISRATAAGAAVLAIGVLFLLAALFMRLAGVPAWWPVLAMIGGLASLGLAGLSLIVGLLVEPQLADGTCDAEASTGDS